jgi:hypothetical protein
MQLEAKLAATAPFMSDQKLNPLYGEAFVLPRASFFWILLLDNDFLGRGEGGNISAG